jgi:hypothetical protein
MRRCHSRHPTSHHLLLSLPEGSRCGCWKRSGRWLSGKHDLWTFEAMIIKK